MIKRVLIGVYVAVLLLWSTAYAQQTQDLNRLTPEQQKAMAQGAVRAGGSPAAQDNVKKKEMLDRKGPGIKTDQKEQRESESRQESPRQEQKFLGEKEEPTFFERYRAKGKYQDISTNLKPFGYDFFKDAGAKVLLDRNDVPVPPSYVIGTGDEIKILLWGRVNSELYLTVDRNGNVTIPQIGPVHVAGMTFEEMSKHLIKQAEQIVGAKIDITMGSGRTIAVFILGDVKKPGAYTIGSFASITDALLVAGGPSNIGSMRNVQLRRKGKVATIFDLYDLLLKGDKSKDLVLEAGDVVFVPVTGPVVGVAGNVKRPAIYELKGRYDLGTLFDLAGGIIPTAYTQQIQIERVVTNDRQVVIDINAKDLTKSKHFELQDIDLVKVFNIVNKEENVVFLQGNVKRPGKYEYRPGMTLKDIIQDETGLLPETHLEYAILKRMESPSYEPKVVPINLRALFTDKKYNIELKPQDNIFIFSKWFFRDKPYVIVEGEVRGVLDSPRKARQDELRQHEVKEPIKLGRGELDHKTLDELRKSGITRLDDPRLSGFEVTNRPDIDQVTIDELRRVGIVSLDDPRLTQLRNQIWPGTREIDQRTIDELRRLGITSVDDPRIGEIKGGAGTGRPDIDQRTIDELRRSGIASLDDPRIAEMRSQSGTGRPEIDQATIDELRRFGIISLDDPRLMEIRNHAWAARGEQGKGEQGKGEQGKGEQGKGEQGKGEEGRTEIDQRTIDELRRLGITSLDDPRVADMRSQTGARVDQRKLVRIPLTDNMTLRDAILAAGGLGRDAYQNEGELYRTDESTRKVSVTRFNVRGALDGVAHDNVVLMNHDRIVIHSTLGFNYKRTVSVDGEVLRPGTYAFAENMKLRDLIFAAGNILESAYLDEAEVTSQVIESDKYVKLERRNISLKRALEGDAANNMALRPYDRLIVKRLADWRKERFVTVTGEVLFPGKYVVKKTERLSSIIERAGGYSDEAYLRGAMFTRTRVRDIQRKTLEEMVNRLERDSLIAGTTVTALTAEEAKSKETEMQQRQRFLEALRKVQPTGRMTIYLANLRLLKGSEYDVQLEEGDSLYIPTKNNVVNVAGAVMSNGSFVLSDGMGYEDYVKMSGGYSRYADTRNVFVMKVDGSARRLSSGYVNWNPFRKRWEAPGFDGGPGMIEAGDSIIVPEKLERTAWLREFRDITQILGNIGLTAATVAVLYKTLKNN